MSWNKWKLGLFVAAISGVCTAIAAGAIFPDMTWRQGLLVLGGSISKDVLLFLKQHPAETVKL